MTSPEQHIELTDETFRAIGRFVYCFSRVVFWMRATIEDAVGNQHLAQIMCGAMTADQIQRAFFGICAERFDATPEEQQIAKSIRKRVVEAISFRNSLAHGDWLVGLRDVEGTNYPAQLGRVHPGSKEQWRLGQVVTPEELDARSDKLEVLRQDIWSYGMTAGGPMSLPWEDRRGTRPSDIFKIEGGAVVRKKEFNGFVA